MFWSHLQDATEISVLILKIHKVVGNACKVDVS